MSDIRIKLKGFRDDDSFIQNYVNLEFEGKSMNHVIMNSLRRVILDEIPILALNTDRINIIDNSSVYNNDYLRNRIEQLPLINISTVLNLDEYEKLRNNSLEQNEDSLLTIYCDVENNNSDITSVTSDDMEFYMSDKKIDSIFKNPVLICKLKPGEKLKFSAKSDIGISLIHARYASVGVCCYEYEEEKNNKFLFKMEPRGQIKSNEVILRGLRILSFKLETLKSKISKIKFTNENQGKIILNNEDHTIGNLIARGLQEHKNIEFAAYKLEHLLIRDLIIEYLTDGGKVINNILTDVISNYQKLFLELEKEISKLNFK